MKWGRVIGVGVALYAVSFIIGLIVMMVSGIDPTQSDIPQSIYIINIILTVVLAAIFTLVYFNGKGIRADAREGLLFGIVVVIMGFVIDVIIFTIVNSVSETPVPMGEYYSNPLFWVALVLLILTTTVIGAIKRQYYRPVIAPPLPAPRPQPPLSKSSVSKKTKKASKKRKR